LRDGERWTDVFESDNALYFTVIDVRVYYEEAALGLADHVPGARSATTWFYRDTETGRLLFDLIQLLPQVPTDPPLGDIRWRFKPTYL
jgi:hypothetical protein